ncbi:hypothetical protein C8R44DRAFT_300162 [Mycena epipterygia]|nr:hypothetical protein C8R44DRAFT_300162 [Mycena epipterygia]
MKFFQPVPIPLDVDQQDSPLSVSFPELPYDIVESILIHAASSCPSTALTLCQVTSWVRNIAVPQLFHTVVLDSYGRHLSFLENRRLASPQAPYGTAKPAAIPLGHHVRNVFGDSHGADMHSMYEFCPFLESLAIPASRSSPSPPLRRASFPASVTSPSLLKGPAASRKRSGPTPRASFPTRPSRTCSSSAVHPTPSPSTRSPV